MFIHPNQPDTQPVEPILYLERFQQKFKATIHPTVGQRFPPLTGDLGGDDDGLRRQEGHGIHFLLRLTEHPVIPDGIRREDLLRVWFHRTIILMVGSTCRA